MLRVATDPADQRSEGTACLRVSGYGAAAFACIQYSADALALRSMSATTGK